MLAVCVTLHAASSLFFIAGIFLNVSSLEFFSMNPQFTLTFCCMRTDGVNALNDLDAVRAAPDGLRHPFV